MKLDAVTLARPLSGVADDVRAAEQRGYDGWFLSETAHDPLLGCVVAGEHSRRLQVGTGIAVAFPRSPMHVALASHDLQALTDGRFVLGLGSQVKAHVEKRFSTVWSQPAARMREYVQALHAIWHAWSSGEPLAFRGEFYRHTLMTPVFTPPPHGHGPPPVWLAAVGPRMTAVAGEVADGLLCHGFTTARYLREVTLPHLQEGASAAGRDVADVDVVLPVFVVTGRDGEQTREADLAVRRQLAFYGSTPAYRPVLDLHGWGGLHEDLHAASLRGAWDAMVDMVPDEVLHTFAVVAPPDRIGTEIRARFGDVVDRLSLSTSYELGTDELTLLREQLAGD